MCSVIDGAVTGGLKYLANTGSQSVPALFV